VTDTDPESIITHDVHGPPSLAFTLAHLSRGPTEPTCVGVFREVERDIYGQAIAAQIAAATERLGEGDLEVLLRGGDTWTVE
jgi:2-oxoglutarate ferredoxin oxidoreductase subunit beta